MCVCLHTPNALRTQENDLNYDDLADFVCVVSSFDEYDMWCGAFVVLKVAQIRDHQEGFEASFETPQGVN